MTESPLGPAPAAVGPEAVYAALHRSIDQHDAIDLAAAAAGESDLAGLRPALAALRIGSSFPLTGAHLSQNAGAVRLVAEGGYGLPGAAEADILPVTATLEYTAPAGLDRFELGLALPTPGWTFADTFPTLPDCQLIQPGGGVALDDSFLAALPLQDAALIALASTGVAATTRMTGRLHPVGPLAGYADFFAPWPLAVDGPVILPATAAEPPALELTAHSSRPPIEIGPVALDAFGLGLRSYVGQDPAQTGIADISVLEGLAELRLGGSRQAAGRAWVQLLATAQVWNLVVDFDEPSDEIPSGLAAVAQLLGMDPGYLSAVPGLGDVASFRVTRIEVGFIPPGTGSDPAITSLAVSFGSDRRWEPPVPYLRIADVGMRWLAIWGDGALPDSVTGTFFGTAEIGPATPGARVKAGTGVGGVSALPSAAGSNAAGSAAVAPAPGTEVALPDAPDAPLFSLTVTAGFPSWILTGRLVQGEIPIDQALAAFFGAEGPDSRLRITELSFTADPVQQSFAGEAYLTTDYVVPLLGDVSLALTGVRLEVNVTRTSVAGGIAGEFVLEGAAPLELPEPRFRISASYSSRTALPAGAIGPDGAPLASTSAWTFAGELYPDSYVELFRLVAKFAGQEPPEWAPSLTLEALSLRFTTGTGEYAVSGRAVGRWTPKLFGTELALSAEAEVDVWRDAGDAEPTARLYGMFAVDKFSVSAEVNLTAGQATYEFQVAFGELWLAAVTGWRDGAPGTAPHQVITFQAGGVTLGDVLEYLVGLAAPTLGFKLDSPWDLLRRIELSRFAVTVDPTDGSVELTYAAAASLPGMSIGTVGVRVRRKRGKPSVELILTGDFLGRSYPPAKPLGWDVLSQSPPTVPGQGRQLLDLRYLALGQRIALTGAQPSTVREAVDRLSKAMRPADPNVNPLRGGEPGLRFAADAGWLIGLDARIAEVLDLAVVFNDPRLYGISIGLRGERAGGLAGLSFEILYKKISADVGVFRVELRLPDAFRRIDLGAVAVTLGVVVVEIYTNGNFLIDLGFPHNRDFSRSFSVEVAPFLGRGGIYFGVLDGTTSARVPAVSNGAFAPVIVLGIGLSVGVGKELRAGPLSGGAYLELIAIFEGVFAWFTPTGAGSSSAQYYRVQATVALHGKIYGSIDFKVLQVSVVIEAWASATLTLESYKATQIRLAASVRVSASVRILFFTVDFSFSASIDLAFTLGADQATPWILGPGGGSGLVRRPELQARLQYAEHLAARQRAAAPAAAWNPAEPVFPTAPVTVDLKLLPLFSADEIPVRWSPAASQTPYLAGAYRVAFCLLAEDGPAAPTLLEALLRYALASVAGAPFGPGVTVTAGQLRLLADELAGPQPPDGPFGLAAMAEFFSVNLHLELTGDPQSPEVSADPVRGTAVPLPPYLSWASEQLGDRDLATENMVGPLYAWGAARYAAQFSPAPPPQTPPPPDDPPAYQPFGGYLFSDWCLMVAKTAVQAAIDAMAAWPADVVGPTTPDELALRFPSGAADYAVRSGDTVDSVAEALGATPEELTFLNEDLADILAGAPAGRLLRINLGVSGQAVALDNADAPLAGGLFPLGDVDYQVAEGDTLAAIASRFSLPDAAALFADPSRKSAEATGLLRARAEFRIDAVTQPWTFALILAAATYFVHYRAPVDVENADWYAQAVFDRNKDVIQGGGVEVIPTGTDLWLPIALYGTDFAPYRSVSGDTLALIGSALSLAQNCAAGTGGPQSWPAFRDAVRAGDAAGTVLIPAADLVILPGESVARLGRRTIVHAESLTGLLDWIGAAPVLAPLALIPVPGAGILAAAGEKLADLAPRTGLALAELGRRLAGVAIYTGTAEEPLRLTVRHLPIQGVDSLVAAVLARDVARNVSADSARQLLSGLRLPSPVYGPLHPDDPQDHATATGPLQPLYALTGQQAAAPAPDLEHPDEIALEVTFSVHDDAPWITLADSTVAGPEDALPEGRIVRTGAADTLLFRYTNAQLAADYPALVLTVPAGHRPQPLPAGETVPVTYGLDHRIVLQSAVPLPLPPIADGSAEPTGARRPGRAAGAPSEDAPLTGTATVWPFPARLRARARVGGPGRYDVVGSAPRPGVRDDVVPGATFATLLSFRLRRTGDARHVYELLGADTENRALALDLYRYLTARDTEPGTRLLLTAAPAPDAPDTAGQAVLAADPATTFLVKTNQSTQGVAPGPGLASPAPAPAPADAVLDYADLADPAGFCLLLWQGSVVGGAGYYLGYRTAAGGDLPAGLFDARGEATLNLLAVAGARQRPESSRPLLPIDTCALLGPNLDPGLTALFVESADGSETSVEPALPQGTVGVRLLLPDPGEGDTPDELVRRLFSLISYAVPDDGRFALDQAGLPAGPLQDDGLGLPQWLRERRERWVRAGRVPADLGAPAAIWRYEKAFPISRHAHEQPAPAVPGLPDPAADPYRGISGAELPMARIQLGFADVLGNLTAPPEPAGGRDEGGLDDAGDGDARGDGGVGNADGADGGSVAVPVGYTDAVLAVSAWPAVTLAYAIEPAQQPGGDLHLAVTVAPQPAATAPAADPEQARAAAQRQAERYAAVYYQLLDQRLTPTVRTSLHQEPDGSPRPLPADPAPLLRFAAGAYLAARAAATVRPLLVGGTLAGISETYAVSLDEIAAANAGRPAATVLGGHDPVIPAFAVCAAGDSADAIAAAPRPAGWPRPADGATLLAMPGNATVLPLRPDAVLVTPAIPVPVPTATPGPTLAGLAQGASTTPGLLAEDNAEVDGILAPGFVFTADGADVAVPAAGPCRLSDIRDAFAAIGVIATVATLAAEVADRDGMFRPGVRLTTRHYVVGDDPESPETLATTRSTVSAPALAALNGATTDLFDDGALVLLGVFSFPDGPPEPGPDERLDAYAARFACPVPLLLSANATRPLPPEAIAVPGTVLLPEGDEAPQVPYTVAAGECLAVVAGRFGSSALGLATANRNLPGTLAPGLTVTVPVGEGTVSTPTRRGDGFGSVYARLEAQDPLVAFDALVAVLADVPGTLAADALLLCPPARLVGAGPTGAPLAPQELRAAYHLDPALIAQANLGTLGLIVPGIELDDPARTVKVLTGPQDTFNTLAGRFAQGGAAIDTTALIAANLTKPFLAPGAAALLPPAPARLAVPLGPAPGPFAAPACPLTTTLRLSRPARLVDPALRAADGSSPAERAEAVIPAPAESQGVADGATLTLAAFAAAFHAAFPDLRLGTARVTGRDRPQTEAADLWMVDFRKDAIASVALTRPVTLPGLGEAPRYFALRPLYNDLVTRLGVPIRALAPDGRLAPPEQAVPTDYQGFDAEVPARRLLADADLFLSAGYAANLYADPAARSALTKVLGAKRILSEAVARGLAPVLDVTDPGAPAGLTAAVAALRQELAVSLSSAYDTAAVVQYEAAVDSPWTRGASGLPPARLYGTATQLAAPPAPASATAPAAGPPAALRGTDQQPYTLSAAKTALDQPVSAVTFLMRVPEPGLHGAVPINLGYDILDLEFDIRRVEGAEAYEDSDWLAFYPPLAGPAQPAAIKAELKDALVPIPLRAYPALPSLIGQTAGPSATTVRPALAETRLWTYALTYAHEHAEQDEVLVTARFNVRPAPSPLGAPPEDVATALARYSAVADGVWALLARYAGDTSVPAEHAANAAATFAVLLEEVTTLWHKRWVTAEAAQTGGSGTDAVEAAAIEPVDPAAAPVLDDGPPEQRRDFRVRVRYGPDRDGVLLLERVILSVPNGVPVPPESWPGVLCRDSDGSDVRLVCDDPRDIEREYVVPPPARIPAGEPPVLTLDWARLPVASFQNARGELSVQRNLRLLGTQGPATAEDFVYQTPLVQAPAPVAPLLSWPEPVDISLLGDTLRSALTAAFTALSDPVPGLPATIGARYGHPMIAGADAAGGLMAYVPVTLAPDSSLTAAAAAAVAAEVERWSGEAEPAPVPGRSWAFALTVQSQLNPSARQPLLSLGQVVYRLES